MFSTPVRRVRTRIPLVSGRQSVRFRPSAPRTFTSLNRSSGRERAGRSGLSTFRVGEAALLHPRRHSSVRRRAISTVVPGPDVVGYRSNRGRTAIRSGAHSSVPPHDSTLSWRLSRLGVGPCGRSGETTLMTEQSGRPGPAVVGYLVKDESPSGVRIPRPTGNAAVVP